MIARVLVVVVACIVVARSSIAKPTPPLRAPVVIAPGLKEEAATGLFVHLELRARAPAQASGGTVLASCRVIFDLWDEVFRIDVGRTRRTVRSFSAAVATCVGELPIDPRARGKVIFVASRQ